MYHPFHHARTNPDKPATIMAGSGEVVTYGQLEARSNQGAHLLRSLGLKRGDSIALHLENHPRYFEICWAAQRAGLYYTCISSALTAGEVEYIVRDCSAKLFITSTAKAGEAGKLAPKISDLKLYSVDKAWGPFANWEEACAKMPVMPIADETPGVDMLYSSGTTGRPKGIKLDLKDEPIDFANSLVQLAVGLFGFSKDTVYLSPAPLYHAAPLRWCMTTHRVGGTVIVMEKFDPDHALQLIEKYKVTASQWVPTHFVRMLKLPEEARRKYDVSSLKCAIHAAAPCPVQTKEAMIDWWGPVLQEYYAGSEGNGFCYISSAEWLKKPGSVGTAKIGKLKICDENGDEVPAGTDGAVFFAEGNEFAYHNDPDKTAQSKNKHGWTTLGDVGHVDEDGYLFLTDRKAFMIISGGVNIYPQELENLLVTHPKVADAAVVGAPDEEMGEKVVAVIQPMNWAEAGEALRNELMQFARENISRVKAPKQIDFMEELPRHQTGKLYKRIVRDAYWGKKSTIV
ncbi:MAG: acyl-CoA synthetase [Hyphomicrobiales bacterium]|nr:acyl-CoA synthetase [Hyphomicrobiales bacterium]